MTDEERIEALERKTTHLANKMEQLERHILDAAEQLNTYLNLRPGGRVGKEPAAATQRLATHGEKRQ